MIFVTLGTQDKPFVRLLDAVNQAITDGIIKDEVIVQAGCTKYNSDNMQIFDLIDRDDFDKYVKKCDVLITHGGVGSIINGLRNGKKVISVARLAKYKEHVNDHQIQIIENFDNLGYIVGCTGEIKIDDLMKRIEKLKPKKYEGNNEKMIKLVEDCIDN